MVNVLKLRTVVACHKSLDKQGRPRSDCFCSLIRVFPVCFSDKHFVSSSPDNDNRNGKVFEISEHLKYDKFNPLINAVHLRVCYILSDQKLFGGNHKKNEM